MEKAFDTVRRDIVFHALNQIDLSPDVFHMIQTWLAPHKYHIPFKSLIGTIDASRGIKQGSTDAPILWTLCMHLIMQELLQRYSHQWLHDHLIIYADDIHLRWTLNSIADGQCALGDPAHVLHTFRSFGFNINAAKSVVLFRAVGKGVSKFTRHWICRTTQGPQLLIPDTPFRLPVVAKTAYLGMILSYRAWETDTTTRRIKAAQHCYLILKRWLQAQSIPAHVRFRLYQQCVMPTVLYGVHEMGLPGSCCRRIVSMINVHYRRMTHSPVHLTHEHTTDFFTRLEVTPPWTHIANHHSKLTTTLANKIQSLMEPAEPH